MLAIVALLAGCVPAAPPPAPTSAPSIRPAGSDALVLVGRVITMADPPVAEAIRIEGGVVRAVGTRDEVLGQAGAAVRIVDLGANVAYPGFIDAHAHWIGDRAYAGIETAEAAMDLALRRGWSSISEQWVNPERLDEITALAAGSALPLRVDGYLALNYGTEFLGDWYTEHTPGLVADRLAVRGLKIHLDSGWGDRIDWEAQDLTETIARADAAGWQVSVHSVSRGAQDLVLDAFGSVIGPAGPNPRHHRVEHLLEVTDAQLGRLAAMDLVAVIHPEGTLDWVTADEFLGGALRDAPDETFDGVGRWRDYVAAGLHVAAATDAPWLYPDFAITDDVGGPGDLIASAMAGRSSFDPETPSWLLPQRLTAQEALRAVTVDAAYALGDETRRGHLAPGALGDVTILSGDVLGATPDEIRTMTAVATIVGGVIEHCSDPAVCDAP